MISEQISVRESDGAVLLTVHVQPGAKQTQAIGRHGDALKVRVAAPPVEGKANDELTSYLSRVFQLPRQSVRVKRGTTGRRKRIELDGISAGQVRAILERLLSAET